MNQKLINIESRGFNIKEYSIVLNNDLEVVNSKIGHLWELQEQRYGWDEYRISGYEFEKDNFTIDLLFQNQKLSILQVYIKFHDLQEPKAWEGWTDEFKSKKMLKLQRWLENQIGDKREFHWGKINCDKKDGFFNSITMTKL